MSDLAASFGTEKQVRAMTDQERKEMERLCKLIATEQDPIKFDEYVLQLNELVEVKHSGFTPSTKPPDKRVVRSWRKIAISLIFRWDADP